MDDTDDTAFVRHAAFDALRHELLEALFDTSDILDTVVDEVDLSAALDFAHRFPADQLVEVFGEEYVAPEKIFTEYAYFSSYADSWVEHRRRYAAAISDRGIGIVA